MSKLSVPGAELDYETVGEGPTLVMIPGASGNGDIFRAAAEHLKSRFKVVTFDRRGYNRSAKPGEPDLSVGVQEDADDVAALIAEVGQGPAVVFGSSSGGVVAAKFAETHPEAYTKVYVHEPASMMVLPHPDEALKEVDKLYDVYHQVGLQAVMGDFVGKMMSKSDSEYLMANAAHGDRQQMAKDMDYWVEHELKHYPRTPWDYSKLEAAAKAGKLVFCIGADTQGLPPHIMAQVFAGKVGAPVERLAGGHVGYGSVPDAFARDFAAVAA